MIKPYVDSVQLVFEERFCNFECRFCFLTKFNLERFILNDPAYLKRLKLFLWNCFNNIEWAMS
jgi:hypothetical protein